MEYVLLVCTIVLGGFRAIFTKTVNKNASFHRALKTNACMFAVAFITVLLTGVFAVGTMFCVPWWLAIVYAMSMVLAQVCLMKAVEIGPVSTSSLIYNCGLIIAVLFGSGYYQEQVNAFHIVGILLILASFVVSAKKEDKEMSPLWFLSALGGFLFGGSMGIWQKIFRYEYPDYNLDNFMQTAFLLMIAFSLCLVGLSWLKQNVGKNKTAESQRKEACIGEETENKRTKFSKLSKPLCILALGASMGLINKINTFLSGALPSVIVFPCIYGGGIIATSVLSIMIFKEKPTKMQTLSLLIGILGIVLIGVA